MRTALLVIDVQSYSMRRAPKELPKQIANYIQSSDYEFLGFTIFRNTVGSNWEKSLNWHKSMSKNDLILPDEFDDIVTDDNVFEKHTYSAMKQEQLLTKLKGANIESVHLCGIDTDACVLATAFDAFDLDFRVKILFDLSFSGANLDQAAKQIALRNIQGS